MTLTLIDIARMQVGEDVVLSIRCPSCQDNFEITFVDGSVEFEGPHNVTQAEWSRIRKHAEACFKEEHRCQSRRRSS